ncbi:MAG TPA: neuraminidase-like domain-containing protein [Draconibacterium sp.]|nr:neuraminidase-like domain-containing protein [Draconibacterium sp.]
MLSLFSAPLLSRKEALGFSNDEYKTLTDLTYKNLPEYFGEPSGNTIDQLNTAISGGKTFCRRLDISYDDLVSLLQTNFINPGFELVSLFKTLKISLVDLNRFYLGEITDAELDAMVPAEVNTENFGGDIKQWLRDNQQLIMGLITLTDVGPEAAECNFADVELRFALPDNAANSLTAVVYHKFHRFLRLLRKTGWSTETLDYILEVLLPVASGQITDANIDAVFIQLLNRIANFKKIAELLSYSAKKYKDILLVLNMEYDIELRQTQCAKILKLSIPEFKELMIISGIDPLADDMEADEPSLMKFIKTVQLLKAVSLKIADLSYILHHSDITGKLTPTDESLLAGIKILCDTLNAVEKENSAAPDNADFNFAKGKMLLVYDAATTDSFYELLMGSKVFFAPLITSEEGLPDKIKVIDSHLGFDAFKKEITFSGIMSNAVKTALENAADSLVLADMDVISAQPDLDTFIADFKTAVGQIFTESTAFITDFATRFPELKVIYDAVIAEITPEAQTKKLVELILPELKLRLKINGLQQALISILKTDPDTVGVLTSGKDVLASKTDATKSVLFDFTELETPLVFDQVQMYTFYLDVPATDDYLIYLKAPENTVLTLSVNSSEIISGVTLSSDGEVKNTAPLSLATGKLHRVELTVSALPSDEVTILWRTKGLEKSLVPASAMYGLQQVNNAKTSLIRFLKAAQIQSLFKFTPLELEYFASANQETKDFLNQLDTDGTITAPQLNALWLIIELLAGFNQMKKENEPEENTWLQVLTNPDAKNTQNKLLLEYFNYWKEADLTAVLGHFALIRNDLKKVSILKKVWDAMNSISEIYYPAADILTWVTNDPTYDLVAGIKAMVKQKVTEESWLESMQTVNDPVRNLLRDALVNYILQYSKPSPEVTDANKLYEYFLIDVEMDACMKTSRIRQALSTIQLFIQRCLMNLEPQVDPASIRADHWVWMKRYRVWEANRKVFLYPENWLEPELRDNKSFLFKELEGELLQAEVTDESAELAFLNYLKKLDDIAKLDIVGMYLQENEEKNQYDDILHVIGRTNGNTRQYFHRRYEKGYWTPWEKVNLNIEGDDVFPIIWRKQLFIFWLNIVEKATEGDRSKNAQTISNEAWGNHAKRNVEVNICWGEYYKGKWTSQKSTDLKKPMIITGLDYFDSNKLLVYGKNELVENPTGKFRERLIFNLRYRGAGGQNKNSVFTFTSKNAPPYLEYRNDDDIYDKLKVGLDTFFFNPYYGTSVPTSLYNTQLFMPGKELKVNVAQPSGALTSEKTESILIKKDKLTPGFLILPLRHIIENQFEAPVSYADEHSNFFIQADESKYTPIRIFDGYYPIRETPIKYFEIPELVKKPIPGWPPEEIIGFGDDVVINNPWTWNEQAVRTNANYNVVLPTEDTFAFGDAIFDTGGKTFQSF